MNDEKLPEDRIKDLDTFIKIFDTFFESQETELTNMDEHIQLILKITGTESADIVRVFMNGLIDTFGYFATLLQRDDAILMDLVLRSLKRAYRVHTGTTTSEDELLSVLANMVPTNPVGNNDKGNGGYL